MKAIAHITKEVETVDEAEHFYKWVKSVLWEDKSTHVNGQVTVKFQPSHPEGLDEQGNPL